MQWIGRSLLLAIGVYSVAVMSFCELELELASKIAAAGPTPPLSHGMVTRDDTNRMRCCALNRDRR